MRSLITVLCLVTLSGWTLDTRIEEMLHNGDSAETRQHKSVLRLSVALGLCGEIPRYPEVEAAIKAMESTTLSHAQKIEVFIVISEHIGKLATIEQKLECLKESLLAPKAALPCGPFARTWIEFRHKLLRDFTPDQVNNIVTVYLSVKPNGVDKTERKFINRSLASKTPLSEKARLQVIDYLCAAERSGEGVEGLLKLQEIADDVPTAKPASVKPPRPPAERP